MIAPLLAVIGRPNVGKSTLFNRLVGGRPALVHDTPHLTRDRRYGETDYFGKELRLVDTGGLDPEAATEVIGAGIHRQAMRAIDEADALLLVVDGRAGVSPIDHKLAKELRATSKPVFLAVNKIDHPTTDHLVHEFYELGLGNPFAISAAHGRGIDALLEAITDAVVKTPVADVGPPDDEEDDLYDVLAEGDEAAEETDEMAAKRAARDAEPLRVAFVGRPNAGKSSLTNRLLGEERSLVHDVAGTTTDPVDAKFTIGGREYVLVDTAGIRRKARIDEEIEKISVSMAIGQIERADVAVLVIDAGIGPSEQDARIAGKIEEAGRALVIALNKSDLVQGEEKKSALRDLTKDTFHFLDWAPVVNLSAQRGDGVDRLLDVVDQVAKEHKKRIPTAQLNRFFADVIEEMPPPLHKGYAVRIHYITQGATRPPTFILMANKPELAPSYKRFIANRLRKAYGFKGTPIRIFVKARKDRHDTD
ncbi:MAG TPA: ribosome biogenesis GTPase Der [Kofleriaceae bacterium]|nr:ribosome biogenesis GTPase Der [Kofleriaceae bacterium]